VVSARNDASPDGRRSAPDATQARVSRHNEGMVTGLEQYHFERAGYFVRRGLLLGQALTAWTAAARALGPGQEAGQASLPAAEALSLLDELLERHAGPTEVHLLAAGSPPHWRRGSPDEAIARIALADDEGLCVLGGAHEGPLPPGVEAALGHDPGCDLEGQVRVRLRAGDAIFRLGSLPVRDEGAPLSIEFRARREDAAARGCAP